MGLPGSGKTTLARQLNHRLPSQWYNADQVRQQENDWDFSLAGRARQAQRMKALAEASDYDIVICDFVAPTENTRQLFSADFTIWMNTLDQSIYADTNQIFEPPIDADLIIQNFKYNIDTVVQSLYNEIP